MGYYENIKCGKCKHSFTDGYARSNGILKTYMGIPYIKCIKCNHVNNTGYKPFSTFSYIEKVYHWFSIILRSTIFAMIFGLLVAGLIQKFILKIDDIINLISLTIILITICLFNIYTVRSEKKEIKFVEEEYEKMT